ncbi:uncharacterized protein LOC131619886 [Vicia villosa]|uniref:uncharacterized protein LOC131619886 n=1 Tax=Vicia villosa TaxID=3911 RepID=UPI00273C11ED|nr:uncharacterized protein LOC131619886 [Vicia villosa]
MKVEGSGSKKRLKLDDEDDEERFRERFFDTFRELDIISGGLNRFSTVYFLIMQAAGIDSLGNFALACRCMKDCTSLGAESRIPNVARAILFKDEAKLSKRFKQPQVSA